MSKAVRALLSCAVALGTVVPHASAEDKGKKPSLNIRATPRFSFSPASILFTAELKGGDDIEELYCPEIEWEWGDGGKSVQESDCDPWQPGAAIERRFTNRHDYPYAGTYRIRVTLSRTGKKIAAQTLEVTVRAGVGDPTMDYPQ